jgi:ABC-type bacteriocin/lantibiotic exporter with double-glycine peptidase domain
LGLVIFIIALAASIETISPIFLKKIIDLLGRANPTFDKYLLIQYLLLVFFGIFFVNLKSLFYMFFERNFFINTLNFFLNEIVKNKPDFFVKKQPGAISTQITISTWGIRDVFSDIFTSFLPTMLETIFVISSVYLLFETEVFCIVFLCLFAYVCALFFSNCKIVKSQLPLRKHMVSTGGILTEIIILWKDIKLLNGLDTIKEFWQKHILNLTDALNVFIWNRFYQSCLPIFVLILLVGVVNFLVINDYLAQKTTLGSIVLINSYLWQVVKPLSNLSLTIRNISLHWADFKLIFSLINYDKEKAISSIADSARAAIAEKPFVSISIKNVSIANRLQKLTVEFNKPQRVLIVGLSGSGKTTFFNALTSLNEIDSGTINFDDIPIQKFSVEFLRSIVLHISGDAKAWKGSLGENLQFNGFYDLGLLEPDFLEQVMLSKTLDSQFLKRDISTLSQGELQRLILSRIWSRNAKVLLLDEVTSSLDRLTEEQVISNILKHSAPLILFASHRLANAHLFDRILVFHKNQIVEDGDFSTLLKKAGHFSKLYTKGIEHDKQ